MKKRGVRRGKSKELLPSSIENLKTKLQEAMHNNPDFQMQDFETGGQRVLVFYISVIVKKQQLNDNILAPLLKGDKQWTAQKLINALPLGNNVAQTKMNEIVDALVQGSVGIYIENESELITYPIPDQEKRSVDKSDKESTVLGPQDGFTESLTTNINMIRWRMNTGDLVTEKLMIGERVPTEIRLMYLKSLANKEDVQTMRQRLQDLVVDRIEDATPLTYYIEDSSTSIFPQFYQTELPSRFSYSLTKGRVGVLVDKSPTGIIAPTSLFSFFESTEDVYMRWNVGSFIRILRFFALIISALLTPAYVAAITFHYEVIPTPLLTTLGSSRAAVPFPPVFEALLLELLIELLREAGARLPTKVGQTIGIVGGIVIGQAAVAAGLTSNILIIVVAISALASFTAPSYLIGSTIRVIRFPLIILSGLLGLIGIMASICFLIIHLLKVTSLGRPYLLPMYPFVGKDFSKTFYRLPYYFNLKRSFSYKPQDMIRYPKKKARKMKDIDD
ncbi:spore germination protein [Sediminibacillus dalangtanensis]|uniref:Spore germination protein n=1 Tax=Sediminibacillus dalangtanensis TaxID=2729421 RepID=A0ABX7VRW0_9BACI|nr:spore germination protein [Sediminibacillus dalangtanensis]QTM98530.1 spore germination protein [Sediminibacillus dalangtanensis]